MNISTIPAIAFDIDGTISARPEFYVMLARAWLAAGGEVHVVTARPKKDGLLTRQQLSKWGIMHLLEAVHHYPVDYEYPFPEGTDVHAALASHAEWKAAVCRSIGAIAIFDDGIFNIAECSKHGILGLFVGNPGRVS